MALADRKLAPVKKGPTCTMGLLLATIDADDRATLLEWLNNPREYAGTRIAEELTAEFGQRIGAEAVQRHRRGRCLCSVESS